MQTHPSPKILVSLSKSSDATVAEDMHIRHLFKLETTRLFERIYAEELLLLSLCQWLCNQIRDHKDFRRLVRDVHRWHRNSDKKGKRWGKGHYFKVDEAEILSSHAYSSPKVPLGRERPYNFAKAETHARMKILGPNYESYWSTVAKDVHTRYVLRS